MRFNRLYYWHTFKRYSPVLLFILALLVRLGFIFTLRIYSAPYRFSEHVYIADNILEGKGYSYGWYGLGDGGEGSFMPPAFVAVILAARILLPSIPWLAIQIFQAFLSACTAVIVYLIGKEVFSELTGIIASWVLAVYPPSVGYVIFIQSLTWEAFWVTLTVLACICWRKYGTWKHASAVGLALGIGVLSRPTLVLLLPFLLIWMVLSHRWRGTVHFIVVAGVFALVLGPWTLRNYLVHEEFVFVSTNGGFTMFQGNNIYATGVSYWELSDLWKQHPELARELAQLDEAARAKRLYQESIAFIRAHPKDACSLALRKLIYFWWFKPRFAEGGVATGFPWYYGLLYMASYAILLVCSVVGIIISYRDIESIYMIYACFIVQTASSMLFTSGTRYRGILEPLLIVLAAHGVVWLFTRLLSFVPKVASIHHKDYRDSA